MRFLHKSPLHSLLYIHFSFVIFGAKISAKKCGNNVGEIDTWNGKWERFFRNLREYKSFLHECDIYPIATGAIQIIHDTGGGGGGIQCHQITHVGGKGSPKVLRDTCYPFLTIISLLGLLIA